MENISDAMTFFIREKIVDVIIGDMLWHENDNDIDSQTRANAMMLFKRTEDSPDKYVVHIHQVKQFLMATRFVGRGLSFVMASDAMMDVKELCDVFKLGVCSDYTVASYAWAACAISLENIAVILDSKWEFSVAFDASHDLQHVSWIDVRVRFTRTCRSKTCT